MRPTAPSRLITARLSFVRPTVTDVHEIFARYASDPEVTRFMSWPTHQSVADTEAFVAFSDAEWDRAGVGPYLVRDARDGRLLGGTGLAVERTGEVTTGYVLARDAWGQGFATEALGAMVDLARSIGVARISAQVLVQHVASRRVLEKCGFVEDAAWAGPAAFPNLPPGAPQDVVCYARDAIDRTVQRAT